MVVKLSNAEKKVRYDKRLCSLLDEHRKVLITVGKNTLIRRFIRFHTEKTGNKDFLNLLPLLVGNVRLIFTKGDLKEVSEEIAKYKVLNIINVIF
ncbi:60S acidic ribosomal protein P0-like [Zingiber officinale]|uniref:60S acidic ribosomal protein P0-like n=1 Tax=Zingiber officinale TaxID=94328 RepID=UPI001C4D7DB3|nr:60S acidic ribosomal protein P0-like [Zingiber officinale]